MEKIEGMWYDCVDVGWGILRRVAGLLDTETIGIGSDRYLIEDIKEIRIIN